MKEVFPLMNTGRADVSGSGGAKKIYYDNLDLIKALAILLVITLHLPLWLPDFISIPWTSRTAQYAFRLISEGVPVFVTVNGFLLLRKRNLDLKAHLKKCLRLFTLMIIWAVILTVAWTIIHQKTEELNLVFLLRNIFDIQVGAQKTGVLWFLQNLLGLYLIFPVIHKLYQEDFRLFKYFFVIVFIFSTGLNALSVLRDLLSLRMDVSLMNEMINFLRRFSSIGNEWYILYFCLGGLIYHYLDEIRKRRVLFTVLGFLSWPAAFAIGYVMSVGRNSLYNPAYNYNTIFMILFIIGLFAATDSFRKDKSPLHAFAARFGQRTFGIYCVHYIFIWYIRSLISIEGSKNRVLAYIFVVSLSFLFAEITGRVPYLRKLTEL